MLLKVGMKRHGMVVESGDDIWTGKCSLKVVYQCLFEISLDLRKSMVDCWCFVPLASKFVFACFVWMA